MIYNTVAATLTIPFFVQPIQAESVNIKTFRTVTSTTTSDSSTTTAYVSNGSRGNSNQDSVFTVHDEEVLLQGEDLFVATDHHHRSESLARDDEVARTFPGESLPAFLVATIQHNEMDQERKEVSVANPYNNPSLLITTPTRHDFFSVVTSSGISSRETSASNTRTSCHEETQSSFRLELTTDEYPSETSWKVVDLNTNEIVAEKSQFSYTSENTVYNEYICISNQACVEFTIQDSANDGICCGYGEGFLQHFLQ